MYVDAAGSATFGYRREYVSEKKKSAHQGPKGIRYDALLNNVNGGLQFDTTVGAGGYPSHAPIS